MEIDFNTKPTYGGDDKYKIYIYIYIYMKTILLQILIIRKGLKKYQNKK